MFPERREGYKYPVFSPRIELLLVTWCPPTVQCTVQCTVHFPQKADGKLRKLTLPCPVSPVTRAGLETQICISISSYYGHMVRLDGMQLTGSNQLDNIHDERLAGR